MKTIALSRYKIRSFWGSDKYAYGDLFGLCYLPQFEIPAETPGIINISVAKSNRDINLYALVDSHIYEFVRSGSVFYGVKNYWYSRWSDSTTNETIHYIDTTKKNVLLLEVVEHEATFFIDTNHVINKFRATNKVLNFQQPVKPQSALRSLFYTDLHSVFNKKREQNLEFNLFNYRLFTPIKELKAAINYKIFNRVDKDIEVSGNGKYLYLKATVDTNYQSSFYPVSDDKVNKLVAALNKVYDHYKSIGFDEVYFAVIPNPVSILEPIKGKTKYNQLAPRIQNNPALRIKMIDLYDVFKNTKLQVYRNSDTHYTNTGYKMWVEEFNKKLMAADKMKK